MSAVLSVQIPHQLEGKQKALDLFVTFLKEYNLWDRFCAVTYRGIIMSTSHVLGEYAEKIVASLTIYNLQNRYAFFSVCSSNPIFNLKFENSIFNSKFNSKFENSISVQF